MQVLSTNLLPPFTLGSKALLGAAAAVALPVTFAAFVGSRAFYRLSAAASSFGALWRLDAEKLDAFFGSYVIYDCDWVNEKDLVEKFGQDYYSSVKQRIIAYYSVLNHLCAIGEVEKMYIPPAIDLSKGIMANQDLYEEMQSRGLAVQPGGRLLDIGCGRGRVLAHMARLNPHAQCVGINIESDQLRQANEFAAANPDLRSRVSYQYGDINEPFPFPDNSFDGAYQIQVFSLSKDLAATLREVYRVLKPGARFAMLDWVQCDTFDPQDPHHADLMRRIKPLIGAIGTPTPNVFIEQLEAAGFVVKHHGDASVGGHQAPLIRRAAKYFTSVGALIQWLSNLRLVPPHFAQLFERLNKDGDAFIEADELGLVTTSYHVLAEKPLQ